MPQKQTVNAILIVVRGPPGKEGTVKNYAQNCLQAPAE